MTKTFKTLEEMRPYYRAEINTYVFKDDEGYFDVELDFDLRVKSNITAGDFKAQDIVARNINARNIDAWDIDAWDIKAQNINAREIYALDISYYAVCIACRTLKCESIKGWRENALHKCLDGEIEYIQ